MLTLSPPPSGAVIVQDGPFDVRELDMENGLADVLWEHWQRFPSLFNDLNRGQRSALDALIANPYAYWAGVWEHDVLVAVAYTIQRTVNDATLHLTVFDKKPEPRIVLFRQLLEWLFKMFPYSRLTIEVPVTYSHTIRLAKLIGFMEEGRKRAVYMMHGRYLDQLLLGITREEVL